MGVEEGVVAATDGVEEWPLVPDEPAVDVSFGGATHPARMIRAITKRLKRIDLCFVIIIDYCKY